MFSAPLKDLPSGPLDCLKKRRLLNEPELRPEVCRQYGQDFLQLGWWEDALAFFQKGNDAAGIEQIKAYCLEAGDAYMLARTGERDPQIWLRLGEQALSLGKLYFARRAFTLAGADDQKARVDNLITGEAAAASTN
jgi:hypothetical protein